MSYVAIAKESAHLDKTFQNNYIENFSKRPNKIIVQKREKTINTRDVQFFINKTDGMTRFYPGNMYIPQSYLNAEEPILDPNNPLSPSYEPRLTPFFEKASSVFTRRILVLVDLSGSMHGTKFKTLRQILMVFLRRLNENTRLNVILVKKFGDKLFKFIQQDEDSTWDDLYPMFEKVKNRFYYNLQ